MSSSRIYVYYNDDVFMELAESMHQALEKLGYNSQLINRIDQKMSNLDNLFIILGLNNEMEFIPKKYVVYQMEQTGNQHSWFSRKYLDKLRGAMEIWDYSLKNIQNMKQYIDPQRPETNFPVFRYVPMGYMPCLKKILPADEKKYDVLFYGSSCPRRDRIIRALRAAKLRVYYGEYSLWGEERDSLIAESRIVLNVHYYPKPILETSRSSYLVANKAFVISEPSLDPVLDLKYQDYVKFVEYDNIVEQCLYWIKNEQQREEWINQTHDKFIETQDFSQVIPKNIPELMANQVPKKQQQFQKKVIDSKDKTSEPQGNIRPKFVKVKTETTNEGEILKSGPSKQQIDWQDESTYPVVSLITPTRDRHWMMGTLALRNFYSFIYPKDKLEWVIIDSEPKDKVKPILPSDPRIKYYQVDAKMELWEKRNYGVEKSSGQIIMHMDDDDYYLPTSILAKVKLLDSYWGEGIECVGSTELGIYHLLENYSYLATTKYLSEASMAYTRNFWKTRGFVDQYLQWGEGCGFVRGREKEVLDMPYHFNFIAITHHENVTGSLRTIKKKQRGQQYDNFFNLWDRPTQLFFMELRSKAKILSSQKILFSKKSMAKNSNKSQ